MELTDIRKQGHIGIPKFTGFASRSNRSEKLTSTSGESKRFRFLVPSEVDLHAGGKHTNNRSFRGNLLQSPLFDEPFAIWKEPNYYDPGERQDAE